MKNKPLQFIPGKGLSAGHVGDHCGVVVFPDGSQIVLSPSDPKRRRDFRRRYKEGKPGLPVVETRNEFGARAVNLINLIDQRTSATILAALRYYQNDMDDGKRLSREVDGGDIHAIATNHGKLRALTANQIDTLCENLNPA